MNKALQPSPSTKNSEEQHQKCTFWGLYIFCSLDPWPLLLHLSGKNGVKISNIFICLFRKIAGDLVNQSAPCLSKLSTPAAWLNLYSRVKKRMHTWKAVEIISWPLLHMRVHGLLSAYHRFVFQATN